MRGRGAGDPKPLSGAPIPGWAAGPGEGGARTKGARRQTKGQRRSRGAGGMGGRLQNRAAGPERNAPAAGRQGGG